MVVREWGQRQYTCTQCTSLLLVPPPLSHVVFVIPREKQNAPSIRTPVGLRTSKIGWVAVLTTSRGCAFHLTQNLLQAQKGRGGLRNADDQEALAFFLGLTVQHRVQAMTRLKPSPMDGFVSVSVSLAHYSMSSSEKHMGNWYFLHLSTHQVI